jgi:hypothetical protein
MKLTSIRRMNGAVLLTLLAVLVIAVAGMVIASRSLNQLQTDRQTNDAKILMQARDSLLGYALQQATVGRLPCPDRDGNGLADAVAGGCSVQRGWLPFRDLGLPDLRDSSGARLWYAVEQAYTLNTVTNATAASLTLDGTSVVAVVLAPRALLDGQQRIQHRPDFTDNFNANAVVAGYLEGVNSVLNTTQYSRQQSNLLNDQVVGLARVDYWATMALLP